jgi:hypothetical protein
VHRAHTAFHSYHPGPPIKDYGCTFWGYLSAVIQGVQFFFFAGTRVRTQGFALAKQVLCLGVLEPQLQPCSDSVQTLNLSLNFTLGRSCLGS